MRFPAGAGSGTRRRGPETPGSLMGMSVVDRLGSGRRPCRDRYERRLSLRGRAATQPNARLPCGASVCCSTRSDIAHRARETCPRSTGVTVAAITWWAVPARSQSPPGAHVSATGSTTPSPPGSSMAMVDAGGSIGATASQVMLVSRMGKGRPLYPCLQPTGAGAFLVAVCLKREWPERKRRGGHEQRIGR